MDGCLFAWIFERIMLFYLVGSSNERIICLLNIDTLELSPPSSRVCKPWCAWQRSHRRMDAAGFWNIRATLVIKSLSFLASVLYSYVRTLWLVRPQAKGIYYTYVCIKIMSAALNKVGWLASLCLHQLLLMPLLTNLVAVYVPGTYLRMYIIA